MFEINDLVVYENSGVCRLTGVEEKDFGNGARIYYVLEPLFTNDGTIYTPVGNTKVTLRPVITREEALSIIRSIPENEIRTFEGLRTLELEAKYREASRSHECGDLIKLAMAIYQKMKTARKSGKKVSDVDDRYLKKMNLLIDGELSVALGIERSEVPSFIEKELKDLKA